MLEQKPILLHDIQILELMSNIALLQLTLSNLHVGQDPVERRLQVVSHSRQQSILLSVPQESKNMNKSKKRGFKCVLVLVDASLRAI